MGKAGKIVGVGRHVESLEFTGVVTVGEESAAILRARGYDVQAGDSFDLGRLAYHHRNPVKRWLGRRKVSKGFDPHTVVLPS